MGLKDKIDEMFLGGLGTIVLGGLAYTAIQAGYNGGTAQICITGIVGVVTAALGLKAGQREKQ